MGSMSFNKVKERTAVAKAPAEDEAPVDVDVEEEVVYDASADDDTDEEEDTEQVKPKTRQPAAKKTPAPKPAPEPTPAPAPKAKAEPVKDQPPAKVEKQELAGHFEDLGDLVGFEADDITLPRLALIQKTSEAAADFEVGTFIMNKEIPLTTKADDSFQLIALTARKFYEEATDFDDESAERRRFDTKEEVKAAGGHFNYDAMGDGGYFYKAADILCLVALPEGYEEYEEYNFEGMSFARCMFTVRKSTYALARSIATAKAAGHLKNRPMCDAMWDISSITRKEGKKDWKVINVKSHRTLENDVTFHEDAALRLEFLNFVRDIQKEVLGY